jgi:hypothetical protein
LAWEPNVQPAYVILKNPAIERHILRSPNRGAIGIRQEMWTPDLIVVAGLAKTR